MAAPAPTLDRTWVDAIERLTPANDRVSSLLVRWHPDCERWLVYQLIPPQATPSVVCAPDQKLAHKTVNGDRYLVPDPTTPLLLSRDMLDHVAWAIYQETGRYARSYWVVQGEQGGHKRRFGKAESMLAKAHGFPAEPPAPGGLPYAPVDKRVFDKLAGMDVAQTWAYALALDDRRPEYFDHDEKRGMEEVRRQLWAWLETQVDRAFDETQSWKRRIQIDGDHDAPSVDYGAVKEALIAEET